VEFDALSKMNANGVQGNIPFNDFKKKESIPNKTGRGYYFLR